MYTTVKCNHVLQNASTYVTANPRQNKMQTSLNKICGLHPELLIAAEKLK